MRSGKLLVIGGATVNVNDQGDFLTKNPIAHYLNELSLGFNACTWVANREMDTNYNGLINRDLIRVEVLESKGWGRIASWFRMARIAWTHDFVLYYLPNHYLPVFPLIRWRAKRVAIYLAGDYESGIENVRANRWPGWASLMRLSFELPMRKADVVIARGRKLCRIAQRFNQHVRDTVPLGHIQLRKDEHLSRKDKLQADAGFRLLFVGKLLISKGVGTLLAAFRLLLADYPDCPITLDVVGEGDDRDRYQNEVKSYSLDYAVTFHGWVADKYEIDILFRRADVLVVPTISYPEGVPRVIDEAIIRGVPVISTQAGGIGDEFIDGEVLFVDAGDPSCLLSAIKTILFDLDARHRQLQCSERRRKVLLSQPSAANQHLAILRDQD
jgi:glycosyltransferase involved in cell wall biosynthesis